MDGELVWTLYQKLRETNPLVQCITNYVSMDIMANVLLAIGASPAMAHAKGEALDFSMIASAVSINTGTVDGDWYESMLEIANKHAGGKGKPWVLDPVAVGATEFRTARAFELMDCSPTVVRGNASEIKVLAARGGSGGKGVDSTDDSSQLVEVAKSLASSKGSVVVMTGAVDVITDGVRVLLVKNGHPMMQLVTAVGCSLSSVVGAFISANPEIPVVEAAAAACCFFGVVGQLAYEAAPVKGPGSFRVGFMDLLHVVEKDDIVKLASITEA